MRKSTGMVYLPMVFTKRGPAESVPIAQCGGLVGAAPTGFEQVEVDLGVVHQRQFLHRASFQEEAFVVRNVEPDLAGVGDGTKPDFRQGVLRR